MGNMTMMKWALKNCCLYVFRHVCLVPLCMHVLSAFPSSSSSFFFFFPFFFCVSETIRDLLAPPLAPGAKAPNFTILRVPHAHIPGLQRIEIRSLADALKVLADGHKNRTVGQTKMNEFSSRSHSVLTITITRQTGDSKTTSRLNLVGKGKKKKKNQKTNKREKQNKKTESRRRYTEKEMDE